MATDTERILLFIILKLLAMSQRERQPRDEQQSPSVKQIVMTSVKLTILVSDD